MSTKFCHKSDNYSREASQLEIFISPNGLRTCMKASSIYMEDRSFLSIFHYVEKRLSTAGEGDCTCCSRCFSFGPRIAHPPLYDKSLKLPRASSLKGSLAFHCYTSFLWVLNSILVTCRDIPFYLKRVLISLLSLSLHFMWYFRCPVRLETWTTA